ncbi:unnamed protein product [Paramecium primaurelia]|uniref:Uncharacterized protein n=4 Tax=Paramecium TaxID=5884 RepID=A0DAG2_PARTE|nr:uncharacterized protein GSPATT00014936001 [Paramecium tetraurelia]CAD8069719.1 unnamed protein product [Paramecium primaurelia]CAD8133426.1 unnamed protein product [Paramecium pentaurelia]CAD8175896.1 unnamed protein product [Paramecium octaurelia]CAK80029.1 unnamed protein product [Paramecium tetraurelia]|eukprot:XP_001447426.1 hypothetical protein (macronuclear) [Paramecium tetraurelia strain d4-2]
MNQRSFDTQSLCRKSKKIDKKDDKSYWQQLENSANSKFGRIRGPKKIIDCFEKNKSFVYLVEDCDGKKKLIPDLVLEEKFPQFMIKYLEEIIQFN